MSPKHTPGPWTWDAKESEIRSPPGSGRHSVGRFHSGRNDMGNDGRPLKADALLMVAAPVMLEALKLAAIELERLEPTEEDPDLHPTLDAVRAAIAKAEGKE